MGSVMCIRDSNKPLVDLETSRYKKRSRMIWMAETVLGCSLYGLKMRLGFVVAASHLVLSLMLVIGMVKNQIIKRDSGR